MARCSFCDEEITVMPFKCHHCGNYFCPDHNLPENHKCAFFKPKTTIEKNIQLENEKIVSVVDEGEILAYQKIKQKTEETKTVKFDRLSREKLDYLFLKKNEARKRKETEDMIRVIFCLLILTPLLSQFIRPSMLTETGENIIGNIGNPKNLYFYDVSSDCDDKSFIRQTIHKFSSLTGVGFVELPYPLALITGGFSYSCSTGSSSFGVAGESEAGSGLIFINFIPIPFAWNEVRVGYSNKENILYHETLHSMGFGHSKDKEHIMYPIDYGQTLDPKMIQIIQKYYANNPVSYLNILPLNVLVPLTVISLIWLFRQR